MHYIVILHIFKVLGSNFYFVIYTYLNGTINMINTNKYISLYIYLLCESALVSDSV